MNRRLHFLLTILVTFVLAATSLAAGPRERTARPELPLRWDASGIKIALSTSLLRNAVNIKAGTDVAAEVRKSLEAWNRVIAIDLVDTTSDRQSVSPQGPSGDGVNLITVAATAENASLFTEGSDSAAAMTRVFYDARGRISEADIVLNPYQQFSSDGTVGTFDLQATITHELGHLLGLRHSAIRGSVMHANAGRNGLFGLSAFTQRTISEVDRTALRALYGDASVRDESCCGSLNFRLREPDGKGAAGVEVWLEDSSTGNVAAQGVTSADGSLEIRGLAAGDYSAYATRKDAGKRPLRTQEIGSVNVTYGAETSVAVKMTGGRDDVDVRLTGFNGQLTETAVPLNGGRTYTLFLGGKGLTPDVRISFASPFMHVVPGSVTKQDFGKDVSALSFMVTVDQDIPVGEYSVLVTSASGTKSVAVGAIAVRDFVNPFGDLPSSN